MTDIDAKYDRISKDIDALLAAGSLSDADRKKAALWKAIDGNAHLLLSEFGWESEPEPKGWKGRLQEAFADAGSAMAGGFPPRCIRERARQDVKAQAIKSFEEKIANGFADVKPAPKAGKPAM